MDGLSTGLTAALPTIPAEGSFGTLVDLSEFRADLIVGGAVLIAIEGGEAMMRDRWLGEGHSWSEGGLGSKQFAIVVLGEKFSLKGSLGHKLQ